MSSFSTRPQSFYLSNITQLLAWTPATQPYDAFNIVQVPLRPRPATGGLQVEDCNDFNGGYLPTADLYPQGVGSLDTYNFSFWQYLDHFVYFAHHRVSVPTTWWTNAAHLHGLPVLGTFDFEGDAAAADITLMLSNAATCIQQLVAMAQHYGFDGWFLNVETDLDGGETQGQQLIAFVQDLRTAMLAANPNALVIWYDAVLPQGYVSYQNCLNDQNNPFFGPSTSIVSDGIFANYWWYSSWPPIPTLLQTSLTTAQGDNRSAFAVYTGVDVYARNTGYQQGNTSPGNDAIAALGACVTFGTSTGIYAPGWTFETAATGASPQPHHTNYELADISFWIGSGAGHNPGSSLNSDCVAKYIPERIVPGALPFATNFDRGCGTNFVVRGALASAQSWSNLGLQGTQPTYRYWALPGSATSFAMQFAYGNAYDGGATLVVQGTGSLATDTASYRLYDVDAVVAGPVAIQVVFQPLSGASYPQIQLQLVFGDGSTYTTSASPVILNGWLCVSETMSQNLGKTLAQIVLVVGGSNNGQAPGPNYGATIGLISLTSDAAPGPVQSLAAQAVYSDQDHVGALLTWSYAQGAARYFDIWRTDGASPQWLLRATANAAWIGGLSAIGQSFAATFAVQPVDYSLTAQSLASAATASLAVDAMTFDDGPTIALLGNPTIGAMTVMAGNILNVIQATSGAVTLPQHGDTSGSPATVTLADGDVIMSASGATGIWYGWPCVVQLTLTSRNGVVYGPFGSMAGVTSSTPFSFTAHGGQSIVAFAGNLINVPLAGGDRVNIIQTLQPRFA